MDEPAFEDDMPLIADDQPSFCCCGLPIDCCLYPYTGGEPYPETDLPDTILVDGILFNKVAGIREYEAVGSPDLGMPGKLYASDAEWKLSNTTYEIIFGISFCLIGQWEGITVEGPPSYLIEDEFPDTLTFQAQEGEDPPNVFSIPRISLCVWQGESSEIPGCFGRVEYSPGIYAWLASYTCPNVSAVKGAPQSSPVGTYDTGASVVITVS